MSRFRKKPVVIDAFQLGTPEIVRPVPDWGMEDQRISFVGVDGAVIETLEGTMFANPGDWIICGVAGEVYPCRADIFAATYEPAS